MSIEDQIRKIKQEIDPNRVLLIVVSKTQPITALEEVLKAGHRVFGENQVQEMVAKFEQLPKDIQWHMIGHLQSNKVKYIAPFVHLIHAVDSFKLLQEIDKQARIHSRVLDCLLQVHIAEEETKFGFSHEELIDLLKNKPWKELHSVRITGLMAIGTNTSNEIQLSDEFYEFKSFFEGIKLSFFRKEESFKELSIGMSSDYTIALRHGSTMIRIGSSIFGKRPKPTDKNE